MKCNQDRCLLRHPADLGLGFDCASLADIELVLSLGIDPTRIIFAHTCKPESAIRVSRRYGVSFATFGNIDELDKIKRNAPDMQLLFRIYAQDDTAVCKFGTKFGVLLDATNQLLLGGLDFELSVKGVGFHIGTASNTWTRAIC